MGKPTPCAVCPIPTLHPGNHTVWRVFEQIRTQIRVGGMGEFLGYDFAILPTLLVAMNIPVGEWEEIIEGLTLLNTEAVKIFAEHAKETAESKK